MTLYLSVFARMHTNDVWIDQKIHKANTIYSKHAQGPITLLSLPNKFMGDSRTDCMVIKKLITMHHMPSGGSTLANTTKKIPTSKNMSGSSIMQLFLDISLSKVLAMGTRVKDI